MSLPAHQISQAERENESARHRLSNPVANSAKGQSFKGHYGEGLVKRLLIIAQESSRQ